MTGRTRRVSLHALVFSLCALHVWMAASVSRTFSTTFDEVAHLTAGYAYWTGADYRFHPENGNLPQRWAALPLLAKDVTFPPASSPFWKAGNVWRIGHAFFHENGNDLPAMLAAGRAMNAVLSGTLCFLIFIWTSTLFGQRAGLFALTLAVFCPVLLAHGGLITSDTAAALGFCAASLAWWRLLHRVTLGRLAVAGLAAGFLAISKHSVVLFAPMALIMIAVRLTRRAPLTIAFSKHRLLLTGWRRLPALAASAVVAGIVTVAVIWSAYGFRYRAAPAGSDLPFLQPWDVVLLTGTPPSGDPGPDQIDLRPGVVQHFVRWACDHRLLPEAWLYGLAHVEKHARGRMAYFAGEYRMTGWRTFFPTVFLVKTTLPALLLIGIGIAAIISARNPRRRAWLYRTTPLLALLVVYWAFSIQSKLNIGHRHLLPVYPPFYILAGASRLLLPRHKAWALVPLALLGWHAGASLSIRPDYLAYFNSIGRGPKQAHRLFVDSSLDWGQDLPRLKAWLDKNAGREPVFLSYFGNGSPKHIGIEATRIGDTLFDRVERPTVPTLSGGVYCLSVTALSRIHLAVRGPWTAELEDKYQALSAWLQYVRTLPANAPPVWLDGSPLSPADVSACLSNYEQLLFGRLCHFLQFRQPDARIGYSILVFRLTDEEVALVTGSGDPAISAAQPSPPAG